MNFRSFEDGQLMRVGIASTQNMSMASSSPPLLSRRESIIASCSQLDDTEFAFHGERLLFADFSGCDKVELEQDVLVALMETR